MTDTRSTLEQVFQEAVGHHQAGRLSEAERLYRQILLVDAQNLGSLYLLGVTAYQSNRLELAIDMICKAIAIKYLSVNNDILSSHRVFTEGAGRWESHVWRRG